MVERTVEFPGTGVSAPRIFVGGWRVEEAYFGEIDKAETVDAFAYAFSHGLGYNGAIEYGNASGDPGRSERWAREAITAAGVDSPVVFTKYGVNMPLLHGTRRTPGCHPDSILEDFGGSRERLGREPAGWLLHHYDKLTPAEEIVKAINRLHGDGRVKVVGISHGFEYVKDGRWEEKYDYWRAHAPLHCQELGYNIVTGGNPLDNPRIAYGLKHGVVVTLYSCLGTGLLAPYVLDGKLDAGDKKFKRFHDEQGQPKPALATARTVRDALAGLFESWGIDWVAGVESLVASLHPRLVPIVGVRKRSHVDAVLSALDHLLDADRLGTVAETLKRQGLLPGVTAFIDGSGNAQ